MTNINNNSYNNFNYYNNSSIKKNVAQNSQETLKINSDINNLGDSLTLSSKSASQIVININPGDSETSIKEKVIDTVGKQYGKETAQKLKGDGKFWKNLWNGLKAVGEVILLILLAPFILLDKANDLGK